MVHNNFVVLDEICHWLKLMYLFLRHVYLVKHFEFRNFLNLLFSQHFWKNLNKITSLRFSGIFPYLGHSVSKLI
jgi:hypothetical protein